MYLKKESLFVLLIIFALHGWAQECNDEIYNGEGTFYGGIAGSSGGNCLLPVEKGDYFHCAINNSQYDNSNACGAFVKVTGPLGTITLKVVDRCPECLHGDIDMTQEAFGKIANIEAGRVPISWRFVPANSKASIHISFLKGSTEFWTAVQFRNIEHAISKMEYKKQDGSWQLTNREPYNYFVEPSGIPSPMTIRITSILGEQLIFENILINVNETYNTGLQFSTPSICKTTLSTDELEIKPIILYPNPAQDIVTIKGDFDSWYLVAINGKLVNKGSTDKIQLQDLSKGMYFLHIRKQVLKVIKY